MSDAQAERVYLELVGQHQSAILGFIWRRVGDRDLAEDLTQETFVKAWRALGRLELEEEAADRRRAWLYRIARNTVTDHLRRRARLRWLSLENVRLRSSSDPAGEATVKEPVQRALAALEDEQREVLLLFNHLGFSAAEVGEVLGISAVAARKRRQRAKAAFEAAWEALQEEEEERQHLQQGEAIGLRDRSRQDGLAVAADGGDPEGGAPEMDEREGAPEDRPAAREHRDRRPGARSDRPGHPDARMT